MQVTHYLVIFVELYLEGANADIETGKLNGVLPA